MECRWHRGLGRRATFLVSHLVDKAIDKHPAAAEVRHESLEESEHPHSSLLLMRIVTSSGNLVESVSRLGVTLSGAGDGVME